MPPPPNDDFRGRLAIPALDVAVNGYNASATLGPGESNWTEGAGRTTWWNWTSTVSGEVAVVAPPRKFIAVFTGTTLHSLTLLASGWRQVNFVAQAGSTYQFLLDSEWSDAEPTVRLVVTRPPSLVVTSPTNNAMYYSPATVVISGLAWDPSGQVPEVSITGIIDYRTNANNFSFSITYSNVTEGNYLVSFLVQNQSGARTEDQRYFRVTPFNNMFSNAIPIAGSPLLVTGCNRNANREAGEPSHGWYNDASIWWAWTPTNSGPVKISCALGTGYPYPSLGVYTGDTLSTLKRVADTVLSNGTAIVQFTATAGVTYKIAVDSYYDDAGDVFLGINCPPLPPVPAIPLVLGTPVNNLAGDFDSQTLYVLSVPEGTASLQISTFGGTGDCDLYVRHGFRPTLMDYDFAPYLDGNDETVTIASPAAGDWYVLLHGFGSYSGVTLLAQ